MPKSIGMKPESCTSKYDLNRTRYVEKVISVPKLLAKIKMIAVQYFHHYTLSIYQILLLQEEVNTKAKIVNLVFRATVLKT